VEATRRIVEARPDTRVVVLTSHASDEDVFPALKAGALGYFLKHSAPEDVLQARRQAHHGETVLHPAIARMVLQELHRPAAAKLALLCRIGQAVMAQSRPAAPRGTDLAWC